MGHSALPITHPSSEPFRIVQTSDVVSDQYIDSLSKFNDYYNLFLKEYCSSTKSLLEDFTIEDLKIVYRSRENIKGKQAELVRAIATIFSFKTLAPLTASHGDSNLPRKFNFEIPNQPITIQKKPLNKEDSASHLAPIENLPFELLTLIFQQIPNTWQEVSRLALTSKRFNQITQSSSFLREIFQNRPSLFSTISRPQLQLQLMATSNFQPQRLDCALPDLTDSDLNVIAEHGSNLTHLKFQNAQFTPEGLINLLHHCKNLRSIEFHDCQDSQFDKWIVGISLYAPSLEHIAIIDSAISDSSLFALGAFGSNLRSFECRNRLSQGKLTDYGMIPFLSRLYQLESFVLEGCPQVTQIPIIMYAQLDDIKSDTTRGSHLKQLGFSFCGMIDEQLYETLADECPNLQSLHLGFAFQQCVNNTEEKSSSLKNLFKFCDKLSSIHLRNCTYLSEELITKLFKYNSNIENLELYDCIPFTPTLGKCIEEQQVVKKFSFIMHNQTSDSSLKRVLGKKLIFNSSQTLRP